MIFFTSDLHLNSESTIKSDLRPFVSVNQFNSYVIKTWNKQAKKGDIIYIIGDLMDCHSEDGFDWRGVERFVRKIKADIVLVLGNNEERLIKNFFNGDFSAFCDKCKSIGITEVYNTHVLEMGGKSFFLTHKPFNYNDNYINLFGHSHAAGGIYMPFGLNIGCDLFHFRLVSENDIFHLLDKKAKFWDKDKHLNIVYKQSKKDD